MIIKVDYRDIDVLAMPDEKCEKFSGLFHDRLGLIEINADQDPGQQADTLIHEIIHAIWTTRGWSPQMTEEQVCTRLASGLATVIRDNPDLMTLIDQALHCGVPIVTKGDL